MEIKTLSNTSVGMWLRCPQQWYFRYAKGLKMPPSGAMVQGSAYHGAQKVATENRIKSGELMKMDDILDAYDKSWNDSVGGKAVSKSAEEDEIELSMDNVDWREDEPGELKDEGANLLKLYFQRIAPNVKPVTAEKYYEKQLSGGTIFLGYLDMETESEIIDHKLKGKAMSQLDADKELQPFSYGMLTGKKDFAFHVAVKTKIPQIYVIKTHRTEKEIAWWASAIQKVLEQMKTGICPPNPTGWMCSKKWCGYYDLCKEK